MIAGLFQSQSSGIKTKIIQLANNRENSYSDTRNPGFRFV